MKIVVFESAVPDYFMAHLDLLRVGELSLTPGPTGLSPWPDVAYRLERAPFVTVGLVRGRARGVGNELLMALDLRFASREKAVFGQLEIACGAFPGGGGMERLPRLVGRARALEIIAGGMDLDADTAERYGLVNRALPDAELDAFVDDYARRVASFDGAAIAAAKALLNQRSGLPAIAELAATQTEFFAALARPESQARIARLFERGLQQPGELELRMGSYLGEA